MKDFAIHSALFPIMAFILGPALLGIINRTKAAMAGRRGQPIWQTYYDIAKLLGKGAVYSETTTWVFRAGPIVSVAALGAASLIVPFGGMRAPVAFEGDIILFVYLLGLARFATVCAALDTGSAFEGMGASREVFFSTLAELVFFLGAGTLAIETSSISLSEILSAEGTLKWASTSLVAAAFFVVILAENCRIPVDDPNTHLELTMIHEVMVLDHGGPDFGLIQLGQGVKLWLMTSILVQFFIPAGSGGLFTGFYALALVFFICMAVGMVESTMARLKLVSVPQLLAGAGALSAIGLLLLFR